MLGTVSVSSLTITAWWPMPAQPGIWACGDHHLDLGGAPGRANTGDKLMTRPALAGGDCIDRR